MSPSMSKTIVFPSGLTSTLDHVVSEVSRETAVQVPGGLATSHFFSSFLSSGLSLGFASAAPSAGATRAGAANDVETKWIPRNYAAGPRMLPERGEEGRGRIRSGGVI